MSENNVLKLMKQVSVYFSSGVAITLAGFITFPIWTRVFTEAEYGEMSLATATLGLVIVFSKFGISRAALRFYSEFKERRRDLDITYYYSTAFVSLLLISIVVAILYLIIIEVYSNISTSIENLQIFRILALLIIFDALKSIFLMFLRAEQNAKLHSFFRVGLRYITVAITVLFVLVFKLGLTGFFIGWALCDGLSVLTLFIFYFRQKKINFRHISLPLLKESVSYGLPLIGFEISSILLATGDRFILQHFLGSAVVGIYSASYNVTTYFVNFFAHAFRLAVMPFFMSLWEKKGKAETQKFLSSMAKLYFMIGIPIIFAISFLGRDLIVLLASSKFEEGYKIMSLVVIGDVIYKANFLYGAGLYLKKKTTTLLYINLVSAAVNVVLNIILIPIWGMYAAALTTLIAYLLEAVLIIIISFRTVSFKFPIFSMLKYAGISIIMILIILCINDLGPAQIFVRSFVGLLIYGIGVFFWDDYAKRNGKILVNKLFAKLGW